MCQGSKAPTRDGRTPSHRNGRLNWSSAPATLSRKPSWSVTTASAGRPLLGPTPPSWNEAPALPKAVAPNVDGMAGRKIYHRRFRSYGSGLLRCFGRKCELHIAPSRPNMVGDTELMERRAYRFVSPHRPASSLKGKPEGFVRKAYFCPLRTNSNPRSALVRRLSHD